MELLKVRNADGDFVPASVLSVDAVAMAGYEYSEEEKVVGCYIDGKPIYRKSIPFESFSFGNIEKELTTDGIYETLVKYGGYALNDDGITCESLPMVWSTTALTCAIKNNQLCIKGNRSSGTATVNGGVAVFEYTKTTDEPNSFRIEMLGMKPFVAVPKWNLLKSVVGKEEISLEGIDFKELHIKAYKNMGSYYRTYTFSIIKEDLLDNVQQFSEGINAGNGSAYYSVILASKSSLKLDVFVEGNDYATTTTVEVYYR